jgi:hypothetical protein
MRLFTEILDRLKSPTPVFWKRVRNFCIALGGAGLLILSTPDYYPTFLVNLATYFTTAGIVGMLLSQLTVDSPTGISNVYGNTTNTTVLPNVKPESEDVEDPLA